MTELDYIQLINSRLLGSEMNIWMFFIHLFVILITALILFMMIVAMLDNEREKSEVWQKRITLFKSIVKFGLIFVGLPAIIYGIILVWTS